MSKIHRDIPRILLYLKVIEQYNNFSQLGAEEDINFLKEKANNLLNIKDTQELIKEFTWCCKMVNMYYNEIEPAFKQNTLKKIADDRDDL